MTGKLSRRYQVVAPAAECSECGMPFTGTPFEIEAGCAAHVEDTGHEVWITRTQRVIWRPVAEEAQAC